MIFFNFLPKKSNIKKAITEKVKTVQH